MKVLHLEYDEYPPETMRELERWAEVERGVCNTQQQLYEKLRSSSYNAVFMRLGLMFDQEAMNLQPALEYIVTPTTGLNHIDTEAAAIRNIRIVSLKDESVFLASVKSTAEHTWALLLALIRRIAEARESVLRHEWKRELFLSDELDGKKLGIIGYGRLGKIVARYGLAFGMDVYVYDHDKSNYATMNQEIHISNLQMLLQQCDYVILLISYSKGNENFLNASSFAHFKNGAYLINTSRGEMVDEQALLTALQTGKLKGAALDVLKNDSVWEGRVENSRTLVDYARNHSNLLITPHTGGYGKDSTEKTKKFITNKFLDLIKNKNF